MTDPDGPQQLDEAECRRLLLQVNVGRVALSIKAMPVVVPVNFGLLPDALVVCSSLNASFPAACDRAIVAFQADGTEVETTVGWSVLVQGRASLVDPAVTLDPDAWLSIPPWGDTMPGGAAVRIRLDRVTGHRVPGLHRA